MDFIYFCILFIHFLDGALHFYVNGTDLGPAVSGVPENVYAVVDMYGKCCQVTVMDDSNQRGAGKANIFGD